MVANYGMSDLGITTHAPPAGGMGFMRKSFEARLLLWKVFPFAVNISL